ncbi:hypothetical protein HPULCUR_011583 [Helicostylum pulchrum]|uniref:Uncharacterized protein n=1 Tax=Helicostylum pulchrum TaxID=562976 RepID=A0ABP9YGH7_9FUNG
MRHRGDIMPENLTILAIISHMFSSLFSRPPDWSTDRPIINYMRYHRVAGSPLLLLDNILTYNDLLESWNCTMDLSFNEVAVMMPKSHRALRGPQQHQNIRRNPPPVRRHDPDARVRHDSDTGGTRSIVTRGRTDPSQQPPRRPTIDRVRYLYDPPPGFDDSVSGILPPLPITPGPRPRLEPESGSRLQDCMRQSLRSRDRDSEEIDVFDLAHYQYLPTNSHFSLSFMSAYHRNSMYPTLHIINMMLSNDWNVNFANTLIDLYVEQAQNIVPSFGDYGATNDPVITFFNLQNIRNFDWLFLSERVWLSTSTEESFNNLFIRAFPTPEAAIPRQFQQLEAGSAVIRHIQVRQAYLYVMANVIQNGRIEQAVAFHNILRRLFNTLIGITPHISTKLTWRTGRKEQSDVVRLYFNINPNYLREL